MIITCIADNIEDLNKLVIQSNKIAEITNAEIHVILFKYYFKEAEIERIKNEINANKIILLNNILLMKYDYEAFANAIIEYYKKYKSDIFLFNNSIASKELATILSSKINVPALLDIKELNFIEGKIIVKKEFAGGVYYAEYETSLPLILSFLELEETYNSKINRSKQFEEMLVNTNVSRVIIRHVKKLNARIKELRKAKRIICVGEAIREKTDLKDLFEIANYLGAEISCSRFLSTRRKWFDEWIGISGVRVKPDIYIGMGISGEPFHVAGILNSKKILAITTDPESEIIEFADYIVICDIYKIIPKLVKRLRKSIRYA